MLRCGLKRNVSELSAQTGLPASSADIVTCSQSLHWMEPEPTFAEVARILRSGGLFVAYDYDWPPTVLWEVEQAYHDVIARYLKHGYLTEQEVGLDHLQRVAQDFIGPEPIPWYFSYRVRIGVK
jgi:SAM-dependent methyltransferase